MHELVTHTDQARPEKSGFILKNELAVFSDEVLTYFEQNSEWLHASRVKPERSGGQKGRGLGGRIFCPTLLSPFFFRRRNFHDSEAGAPPNRGPCRQCNNQKTATISGGLFYKLSLLDAFIAVERKKIAEELKQCTFK
jgi:hypothetical protein